MSNQLCNFLTLFSVFLLPHWPPPTAPHHRLSPSETSNHTVTTVALNTHHQRRRRPPRSLLRLCSTLLKNTINNNLLYRFQITETWISKKTEMATATTTNTREAVRFEQNERRRTTGGRRWRG